MEENISKALSSFSVVFFIIVALTLFFTLYEGHSKTIKIVNNNISERGSVYQINSNEIIENEVLGAAITGCIKNGLETDISIDSIMIFKSTDPNMINFSIIDNSAKYSTEYVINDLGEITLVKYQKQ